MVKLRLSVAELRLSVALLYRHIIYCTPGRIIQECVGNLSWVMHVCSLTVEADSCGAPGA